MADTKRAAVLAALSRFIQLHAFRVPEIRSDMEEPTWRQHLPAILILGSPALAAGLMLTAALTEMFLLPSTGLGRVGVTLIVPINFLLGAFGAGVGALRVGGNVSTRITVFIASIGFASAVYGGTIFYAHELIPGFAEGFKKYGP